MGGFSRMSRWQAVLVGLAVALGCGAAAFFLTSKADEGVDATAVVIDGECSRQDREDGSCTVYVEYEGERFRLASNSGGYREGQRINVVLDAAGEPDDIGTVAGQKTQGLVFGAIGVGGLLFAAAGAIVKR